MLSDKETLNKLKEPLPTKKRPIGGGKSVDYVPAEHIIDRFNEVWGFDWTPEILREHFVHVGSTLEIAITLRLHYPTEGGMKFKDAFAGKKYESGVGLGNALKACESLAIVKAASLMGMDTKQGGDEEDIIDVGINAEQLQKIAELMIAKGKSAVQIEKKLPQLQALTNSEAIEMIKQLETV